jgi:hypothetical protein
MIEPADFVRVAVELGALATAVRFIVSRVDRIETAIQELRSDFTRHLEDHARLHR